jgi:hypothetical protein
MTPKLDDQPAAVSAASAEPEPFPTETKPYGQAFTQYGLTHENVLCVTNDLTTSC